MTSLAVHRPTRTPGSATLAAEGRAVGAPIEKIIELPTGCPSLEMTRQLSTYVPRPIVRATLIVTVSFSAVTEPSEIGAPSGPMRRITSGGHRLVERQAQRWRWARDDRAVRRRGLDQRSMRPGLRRLRQRRQQCEEQRRAAHGGDLITLLFGQQFQPRRGLGIIAR